MTEPRAAVGREATAIEQRGVAAAFRDERPCREAAQAAEAAGWAWEAYAPCQDEAWVRRLRPASVRSRVRAWTLAGGIFGGVAAFTMTIWMSFDWPLIVGGKPVVSWPPFIDVAFEMTVLYAAFACVAGFLLRARLPRLRLPESYRARYANDRFGLFIACSGAERAAARALLGPEAEDIRDIEPDARGRLAEAE